MRTLTLLLLALLAFTLSGCAEMLTVTPELQTNTAGRKVAVKSKVMAVSVLDYSPDGKQLVSGGIAPSVMVWDTAHSKKVFALSIPAPYGLEDLAYSYDGKLIAASGATGLFGNSITRIWNAQTGKLVESVPGDDFGFALKFSRDGQYLFGNTFDSGGLTSNPFYNAKQFDLRSKQVVRTFSHYSVGDMSPDGKHLLLMGDGQPGFELVDIGSGQIVWRNENSWPDAVAFTPDGKYFLASSSEFQGFLGSTGTVEVSMYDAATGNRVRQLVHYDVQGTTLGIAKGNEGIKALAVSPDGSSFVTGNGHGDYKLWDLSDGHFVLKFKRPNEEVFGMSPPHIAFSPNGKLVALSSAATVRLYNVASGKEAATMIAFDNGEWLITTPSGYYNASAKGDEFLDVSVGGKPYSISQLRESFYRPDLVDLALAGGSLSNYQQIANIKQPPTISIVDTPTAVTTNHVTVSLQVKDQGGGIGQVRLYRNGTAVVLQQTRNLQVASITAGGQELHYTVSLEPGRNVIRAVAFNGDNTMQSSDATIDIDAKIAHRRPALYAVVVGIQKYLNPRLDLSYSVADARLFAQTLEQHGKGLYRSIHVHTLLTPQTTTKQALIDALTQAQKDVRPEDLFVFYVASHGTVVDGQYLLITSNVGSTNYARLKQEALTQEQLKEMISNISASKKLVVLDTCDAGKMGNALQVALLTRGMSNDTAMNILSRAVGSTILSAATSDQEAVEGYKGHGLFTYVVAQGLDGAADENHDGFVKTLELANYVDSTVPELALRVFNHRQYPIVSPTGEGFPLVKVGR